MKIENEINNDINLEKKQNNFLNTILGQTINTAIDMGLRMILPDLIENQVIGIKNSFLENGLTEGIQTAVKSAIDFGKSAIGIFTGNFENTNQIKLAIGDGGLIDTCSDLLDKINNKVYQQGYINKTVNSIIRKGKNVLLKNIESNIEQELDMQNNLIENLDKYIDYWHRSYENKDFLGMEKQYKKINEQLEKIIPLENIIKKIKEIQNIHNLISNNGHNFEITELEIDLNKKFQA